MRNTATPDSSMRPSFLGAASCIGFLCFMMFAQIVLLGEDWVTHISLIFAIVVTAIIALVSGFGWHEIQKGILYGCKIAMLPMLLLMMVGGLGGAYYMGVLDVSAWDYMGWTFLALITPVIAVIYAMFNLFIWREGERIDVNTYREPEVQAAG